MLHPRCRYAFIVFIQDPGVCPEVVDYKFHSIINPKTNSYVR
jgi:hypothetical protein